ncbi:hypothetical protein M407DRAFT_245983 [Tulasnella calospora MUT 4182]|uniref:Uncharacterized protein n=1 Tax=Tulasnella calospora MUT 4182 TaxID=1051891 RepID=A0A0C3Q7G4_9AGAM|nr:hypothetical protein M407DRAFT_245983 [Tulasnella calospora MUT 4182]
MEARKGEGVEMMVSEEPLTSGEFSMVDSKSESLEVRILMVHIGPATEETERHDEENDGCLFRRSVSR